MLQLSIWHEFSLDALETCSLNWRMKRGPARSAEDRGALDDRCDDPRHPRSAPRSCATSSKGRVLVNFFIAIRSPLQRPCSCRASPASNCAHAGAGFATILIVGHHVDLLVVVIMVALGA